MNVEAELDPRTEKSLEKIMSVLRDAAKITYAASQIPDSHFELAVEALPIQSALETVHTASKLVEQRVRNYRRHARGRCDG